MSHNSLNSSNQLSEIFQHVFQDSEIAKKFTLGRTKSSYFINHGLAPHYKNLIAKSLSPSFAPAPCFVSCFDEVFNGVNNTKQFDLHLIYFNEVKLQGTIVYLGSQFTGHGSAIDLIRTFKDDYHNLNYVKNLLQISVDGPDINWKMLKTGSARIHHHLICQNQVPVVFMLCKEPITLGTGSQVLCALQCVQSLIVIMIWRSLQDSKKVTALL